MDIKELRVGNLLYNGFNELIEDKNISHYNTSGFLLETLKPIELTEKWLDKLGFVNDTVLEFYRNDKTDSTIIIDYDFICLLGYSHVKIKYVHQLQNLYFALTGQELEIKQ
jgi:hypothetical protein